jgi:hypothetical protein
MSDKRGTTGDDGGAAAQVGHVGLPLTSRSPAGTRTGPYEAAMQVTIRNARSEAANRITLPTVGREGVLRSHDRISDRARRHDLVGRVRAAPHPQGGRRGARDRRHHQRSAGGLLPMLDTVMPAHAPRGLPARAQRHSARVRTTCASTVPAGISCPWIPQPCRSPTSQPGGGSSTSDGYPTHIGTAFRNCRRRHSRVERARLRIRHSKPHLRDA